MLELLGDFTNKVIAAREMLDLQAQLDMARWAMWMFWATVGGLFVSVGAVWAAYRSLRASREALQLSRQAAAEAREVGEYQTQAYVHAAGAQFGSYGNVLIKVRNGGLTPATHFCVNSSARIVQRGQVSQSISFPQSGYKIWSALGANEELTVSILERDPAVRQFFDLPSDDNRLLISGQIIYCTVFNHDHVTQFAFYIDPATPKRFRRPTANLITFHRVESAVPVAAASPVEVSLDDNDP